MTSAPSFRPGKQFWDAIAEEIGVKPPRLRASMCRHSSLNGLSREIILNPSP